jgi:hypothetical protein
MNSCQDASNQPCLVFVAVNRSLVAVLGVLVAVLGVFTIAVRLRVQRLSREAIIGSIKVFCWVIDH